MFEVSGHNYIAGNRSAQGSNTLQSHDASTGEALPYQFHQATVDEVNAAAEAAASAFPIFRNLSAARRAGFLEAIATELEALDDDHSLPWCAGKPPCPPAASRANGPAPAARCACSPQMLRRGDFYGARIDRATAGPPTTAPAGPAPVPHRARSGRGVRRQQFSVGLLHRRR